MYISVRLLNGFKEPLLYAVPSSWHTNSLKEGLFVAIPLRKRKVLAQIERIFQHKPNVAFPIRDALHIEPFPDDPHYHTFLATLAAYYQLKPFHFYQRIRAFIYQKALRKITAPDSTKPQPKNVILTDEQQKVYDHVAPAIGSQYQPTLLHGVTGSGKTEVYKKLIELSISQGKSVLLLLPEVTLALQFAQLLKKTLPPHIPLFSFHSSVTNREKKIVWQKLLAKEPILLLGVHIPVLLPIANLGLIIIDEEHEVGYQEKKHPKINSKEAALFRAALAKIPILLGSATPSLTSLYNVKNKNWAFFQLKQRFSGTFPTIQKVFLSDGKQRKNFWLSNELKKAIREQLERKKQTILFLNRRGYSFFVQCKACSFIFTCTNCSVSLTLHNDQRLNCHYCSYSRTMPEQCPECKAEKKKLLKKGIGTQQLVTIIQKEFPQARIARADLDTTMKKELWNQTMRDFEDNNIDILVGTQTITKGYHFPNVTLVGVLWADLNLHFPIYNAAETTLQQLIQVAGRAGRASNESTVIIQTLSDHPIFSFINETRYPAFYNHECKSRHMIGYPPFIRLAEIELKSTDENIIEKESAMLCTLLKDRIKQRQLSIKLLGPAIPPVSKIKNWYTRKIYLKSNSYQPLVSLWKNIDISSFESRIFYTPNPLQ